jgi:hypothetical protein
MYFNHLHHYHKGLYQKTERRIREEKRNIKNIILPLTGVILSLFGLGIKVNVFQPVSENPTQ